MTRMETIKHNYVKRGVEFMTVCNDSQGIYI